MREPVYPGRVTPVPIDLAILTGSGWSVVPKQQRQHGRSLDLPVRGGAGWRLLAAGYALRVRRISRCKSAGSVASPGNLLNVTKQNSGLEDLPKSRPIADPTPHIGGRNGLATASLVLSFLPGLVPLAIILGHVARYQISRYPQEGAGLALAGLLIGYAQAIFWVATIIIIRVSAG